ncbi:MAG: SycD/LcrH family type III secretion system chaperone [Victivallaceae bacterium]
MTSSGQNPSNKGPKVSASFGKKQRSKLAEIAAYKKSKEGDFDQGYPLPSEEETKQALTNILGQLAEGKNLQDILGLSNTVLEEIYTMAYSFYSQGKYYEAIGLFQVLAASKPGSYKYMLGLSSCLHQLKMYDEAAFGFFLAFDNDPTNPIPAYYIADTFLKSDRPEEAQDFIDITLKVCGNKPEYKMLKERCQVMLEAIHNMLKSKKLSAKPATSPTKKSAGKKTSATSNKKSRKSKKK